MMKSRYKALVVATITDIQDINVIYPFCTLCYGRLNKTCRSNKWICNPCQISYEANDIPYRYCLRLTIADETSYCAVSVFGKTLDPYFGLPAFKMHKILDAQYPDIIMEALKMTFIGKCFVFEFKGPLFTRKIPSDFCLLSLKTKCLVGSSLITCRIIENSLTNYDTVYNYLMQCNRLTSKKIKNISHAAETNVTIGFEFDTSCYRSSYDLIAHESIVLFKETKQFDYHNFKMPLIAMCSYESSPTFHLKQNKVRVITFLNKKKICLYNLDSEIRNGKELKQTFHSNDQFRSISLEMPSNIKNDIRIASKKPEVFSQLENTSISETDKNNIEHFKERFNIENWFNQNGNLSDDIHPDNQTAVLEEFLGSICDGSLETLKVIGKQYLTQKYRMVILSADCNLYLLESVSDFMEKISDLNRICSSNANSISGDLFITISEKSFNFSEISGNGNKSQGFLNLSCKDYKSFNKNQERSLLLHNQIPEKLTSHSFTNSNRVQSFDSIEHFSEIRLNYSALISGSEDFFKNKLNKQFLIFGPNHFCQCSESKEEKNIKDYTSKTNSICLPCKFCQRLSSCGISSKSFCISKIETDNYKNRYTSTPVSKIVLKNDFFLFPKTYSPKLNDDFGTPIQRTDIILEDVFCDSPFVQEKKSPNSHDFVAISPIVENTVSFDLFSPSNHSKVCAPLSLKISTKANNNQSCDLFNKTDQFSRSSIPQYSFENKDLTPISFRSDSHKKYCLKKRNILQKVNKENIKMSVQF